MTKIQNNSIPAQEIPTFPWRHFPESITGLIEESCDKLNFPYEITAAGILSAISISIGNSLRIQTPLGWQDKPITWLCIIAPRGTSKTHAINKALRPLGKRVSENFKEYETKLEIWEDGGREGKRPVFVGFVINESTIEGIYKALKNNPHGVLTHADELATWIGNFGRYSGGNEDSAYNTLFNGTQFNQQRKNTELSLYIDDPFWSIIGGLQPTLLKSIFKDNFIESGFFDRMQFVFPEDTNFRPFAGNPINPKLWDNYNSGMTSLLDQSMAMAEHSYLRIEDQEKWLKAYNILGVLRNGLSGNNPSKGILSKAQTMLGRWCLIAHGLNVAFNGKSFEENITPAEIDLAYNMVNYFIESNLYAFELATNSSPVDLLAENKKALYDKLPDGPFARQNAHELASNNGFSMGKNTVDRFLSNKDFFTKSSYGEYLKKY